MDRTSASEQLKRGHIYKLDRRVTTSIMIPCILGIQVKYDNYYYNYIIVLYYYH